MAEHSLFSKIVTYLDKHMIFPLLENMTGNPLFDQFSVNEIKLKLLQSTNMIDYAMEIYPLVKAEIPEELNIKRKEVLEQLAETKEQAKSITNILADPEVPELISQERDYRQLYEKLSQKFNFQSSMLEHLYKLAHLHFETGNYKLAATDLDSYLSLIPISHPNFITALWGKLASDILEQIWDNALNELKQLKETIDNKIVVNQIQSLQERTWLLHWSLFVYFNHPDGMEYLVDLFLFQTPYLNIIQTICPHLLRYLTAATLLSKKRRQVLKDLIKIIKQESYCYTDSLLDFMTSLFVDCDFQATQKKLAECALLFDVDFFISPFKDDCLEVMRQMTFERFCKIHNCVSMSVIAERLNMELLETEQWVANLIKTTRIDAKIDFNKGHVIMNMQTISPYQKIIDKAKILAYHTQSMASLLENRLAFTHLDENQPQSHGLTNYPGANPAYYWPSTQNQQALNNQPEPSA